VLRCIIYYYDVCRPTGGRCTKDDCTAYIEDMEGDQAMHLMTCGATVTRQRGKKRTVQHSGVVAEATTVTDETTSDDFTIKCQHHDHTIRQRYIEQRTAEKHVRYDLAYLIDNFRKDVQLTPHDIIHMLACYTLRCRAHGGQQ